MDGFKVGLEVGWLDQWNKGWLPIETREWQDDQVGDDLTTGKDGWVGTEATMGSDVEVGGHKRSNWMSSIAATDDLADRT